MNSSEEQVRMPEIASAIVDTQGTKADLGLDHRIRSCP